MEYSDAQIREYIRQVVRATKDTAHVETGFLKRSIKGALIGRNRSVEFREIFYGAYKNNSQLIQNAQRIMPKDIQWKVILEDEDGTEKNIEGTTRTGRKISKKSVSNANVSTNKIKSLIAAIKANGAQKDDTGKGSRGINDKTP